MFLSDGGEREREKEKGEGEKRRGKGGKMVEGLKIDDPRLLTSLLTTDAGGKNEDDSKHTLAFSY